MERALTAVGQVPLPVTHGGSDARGIARFDFSTNGNAAGPLGFVLERVMRADRTRYPDPSYHALTARLAARHGVDPDRVVIAASASEFIHRFTRVAARCGVVRACVPRPGYGDYAAAAVLAGIEVHAMAAHAPDSQARGAPACEPARGDLCWINEPANPTGATLGASLGPIIARAIDSGALVVLDLAYQPLRLDGRELPAESMRAWQLWSPNKACGLTGVRAAYAIAPPHAEKLARMLRGHAASWVVGAEGVAMLEAFMTDEAQAELAGTRQPLRTWRDALARVLLECGWRVHDAASVTPFFVSRAPAGFDVGTLDERGVRLRRTDSMGLPGWLRLSAQVPAALDALRAACALAVREPR